MPGADSVVAVADASTLLPPRLPDDTIRRPRLEERVGADAGAAWTLVVGPPGSGKTTLVRSWLAERPESWSWMTVTAAAYRRSDVADLVVRAVQRARRNRPLDVLDMVDMEGADPLTLMLSLADQFASDAHAEPTVLVIDDAHLLEADEWESMRRLLDRLPPTLHIVVISRSDPPIPLSRDRASGRVGEIRARDLAFDLDETREVLSTVSGRADDAKIADGLHSRTEGWVVGVRLAANALRDGSEPGQLLARLTDRNTSAAEFLLEEVLEQQPAERRHFLEVCACFDVVDAELCDGVTGRSDGRMMLRNLASDGLFVTPTERPAGRSGHEFFRFHPLLAELLRVELADTDPGAEREIRLRAAEWLVAHDRPIDAIEHLMSAGEAERAHQLVLDHFWELYTGEHRRDLEGWLTAVPDEVVAISPDRAVHHCVALALVAGHDGPRWWSYCSEHVAPDDDRLASRLLCVEALYEGVQAHPDAMHDDWAEARRRRPREFVEPLDEVLAVWEVRLETVLGDPARAVELGRALVAAPRGLVPDASALSVFAGALDASGDADAAVAVAQSAVDRWQAAGEPDLPGMVDALVVRAAASRRCGDFDAADAAVDVAVMLPPPRARPHLLVAIALLERARIDHARGGTSWRGQLLRLSEELRMAGAADGVVAAVEATRAELESAAPTVENVRSPISASNPTFESGATAVVDVLTKREITILGLLASHLSLPEIARELYISRHTVKSHVGRIYRKLGVNSRSEAVSCARHLGLLADAVERN